MWSLLTKCQAEQDIHTLKMAMMLSQTFYRERPESPDRDEEEPDKQGSKDRTSREYLKSALIKHPLWQDETFWDDACEKSIMEQLADADRNAWHDLGREELRDMVLRVHNAVFAQIGAYAHSMVEFGCPRHRARQFVRRLCATYELSEDMRFMLMSTCV